MFELSSCSNIVFDRCEITRNVSDYGSFIDSTGSYYVRFRNCTFDGNLYEHFLNEDAWGEEVEYGIRFEECTVNVTELL